MRSEEDIFKDVLTDAQEMAEFLYSAIDKNLKNGQQKLALTNHADLVGYRVKTAIMYRRSGQDPRPIIRLMHEDYCSLLKYHKSIDPLSNIQMSEFETTTDWDLTYTLFHLSGMRFDLDYQNPFLLENRYYANSRYLLLKVLDRNIDANLRMAVEKFSENPKHIEHLHFINVLDILNGSLDENEIQRIVDILQLEWKKRETSSFYQNYAGLLSGWDSSNFYSLDYQLAAALAKIKWDGQCDHSWSWNY